jgi:hypothetical protein
MLDRHTPEPAPEPKPPDDDEADMLPDPPYPREQMTPAEYDRTRSWQSIAADEAGVPEFGPL